MQMDWKTLLVCSLSHSHIRLLKKLEQLLLYEKKFSDIGQLSAGIIHNLNTPIYQIDSQFKN